MLETEVEPDPFPFRRDQSHGPGQGQEQEEEEQEVVLHVFRIGRFASGLCVFIGSKTVVLGRRRRRGAAFQRAEGCKHVR